MVYSDLYIGEKRKIPTAIGVLMIVFIVGLFISLTSRSAPASRASKANLKRMEVTNLNPIQVSIFWQTDEKGIGWLAYGEKPNQLSNIALDDRDVSDNKGSYLNHYVTIKNLKPGSQYYYAVISSDKKIVNADGTDFSFKTPAESTVQMKLNPATGKVLQQNLSPVINAVVFLRVNENTVGLSTLTKDSGEWLIPLNSFYDKDTLTGKTFSGTEQVKVEILSEDSKLSTVINSLNNLSSNEETVTIGKDYNFLEQDKVLSASTKFNNQGSSENVKIDYPQEGGLIPGRKPLIKGKALPLKTVSISIRSQKTYSATVTSDKNGNWSYLIPDDLELGPHTITVTTQDSQGKNTVLVRNFTIISNGGLEGKVLGTATGTPTLTIAPSPTPTSPASLTVTLTPTAKPPVSGTADLFPIISGISLIIIGGGILLAF